MKIKVALMFGGKSVEHEISVISALQAAQNLDPGKYSVIPVYISKTGEMFCGEKVGDIEAYKDINSLISQSFPVTFARMGGRVAIIKTKPKLFEKPLVDYVDVAFPVVHGTNAEDGTAAGYLNMLGVPYVGCDVLSAALSMDKYAMKVIFKDNGIPVLPCTVADSADYARAESDVIKDAEEKIGYPMIVKPVNLGSSVGITVAHEREGLTKALDEAFLYAGRALIEHAITDLKEINCSVLGNPHEAKASVCERPVGSDEILSYEDKYIGGGKSKGMASTKRIIPADIPDETAEKIKEYSVRAFRALGCSGVARIDFMIDGSDGSIYLNEINSIPGSLSFYLWEPAGVKYPELLDELISLALERDREASKITYAFDTNVLSGIKLKGLKGAKGKA